MLEHLPDPAAFLRQIAPSISPEGVFVGIVPINERVQDDERHEQICDRETIHQRATAAGFEVVQYQERDPLIYWVRPLCIHASGWQHKLSQAISLLLGVPATLLGPRLWWPVASAIGRLTFSMPTQAGFIPRRQSQTGGSPG